MIETDLQARGYLPTPFHCSRICEENCDVGVKLVDRLRTSNGYALAMGRSPLEDPLEEEFKKAVVALRKAEQNLLLFPGDELHRRNVERYKQEVENLRAALNTARGQKPVN